MIRTIAVIVACGVVASAQQSENSTRLKLASDTFRNAINASQLVGDSSKRDYVVSEIAKAQARAAFMPEAAMTAASAGKLRAMVLVDVATIAANRGEYDAAMNAVQGESRFIQDRVLEEIGIEKSRRGDVRAALLTADSMRDGYDKESVVYFACLELIRQGRRAEAEQLASRLKAPDHALPTPDEVDSSFDWRKPSALPTPRIAIQGRCSQLALLQAGKIDEATSCIEQRPNPADVASDLARLAKTAAELGNLDAALSFTNNPHLAGTRWEDGYIVGALGSIGRLWATVDRSAALKWAEARPSQYQRAVALAGVAEGIATSGQLLH